MNNFEKQNTKTNNNIDDRTNSGPKMIDSIEVNKNKDKNKKKNIYDIKLENGPNSFSDSYHALVYLYQNTDIKQCRDQNLGPNIRGLLAEIHPYFMSIAKKYFEATRKVLNYEKSVEKFHNYKKWRRNLLELDKKRHEVHLKMKKEVEEALKKAMKELNYKREILNDRKIESLIEFILKEQVMNSYIWLTQLSPDSKVVLLNPKQRREVKIREFDYVSDWHDKGHPYKQILLYFNPLQYSQKDIKFKIIENNKTK